MPPVYFSMINNLSRRHRRHRFVAHVHYQVAMLNTTELYDLFQTFLDDARNG